MKPILFNTEQVRNILDGCKTQTRRPLRYQPAPNWDACEHIGNAWCFYDSRDPDFHGYVREKPYQVGDILYVRETWVPCATIDSMIDDINLYAYRADYNAGELNWLDERKIKWHPSIHMPKEAARIFLKVKNVRVERLQDMTHEDCRKEGSVPGSWLDEKVEFELDWNAIYAKRGYSWESNPWVWVYEFEWMKEEGEGK